jgi:sulfhydrogenase subunit alpha
MTTGPTRTISVDYLARVEGEGSLTLVLEGDRATKVELSIFEPPRFFEAFLRGRSFLEAPDITSRICGICPVAYLMSACTAIERGLGVTIPHDINRVRRLLYAGEWIESHTLHAFLLHAPDFLGYPDAMSMAKKHGDWVKKGLRIKKAGNSLVSALGGREIHPVNIKVGGFYRSPEPGELKPLLPELRWAREATLEALEWVMTFTYPELTRDYNFVSLRHPHEYPLTDGRIVSSSGLDLDPIDYEAHFAEEHVAHSTALRSRMIGGGSYLCGPLARFHLNFDHLRPAIREAAERFGLTPPCPNPFKMLPIRLLEVAQCFEESIEIIENYVPLANAAVDVLPRACIGTGATEAPRGLLYHRYELDDQGTILNAKIVPPTSQNQLSIEEDLFAMAATLASLPLEEATLRAELAVRNYDPCISCATHFLKLKIERT